ncbi:uncharacterized protein LOC134218054 [Armigeres subalbatus]|uniref:uncharacterized protein LOC134218054 n=1 Tax=Armigeres subalbatus TaxID=124917 RepID=UPI002ED1C912
MSSPKNLSSPSRNNIPPPKHVVQTPSSKQAFAQTPPPPPPRTWEKNKYPSEMQTPMAANTSSVFPMRHVKSRALIVSSLQRIYSFVQNFDSETMSLSELEIRLEILQSIYGKFNTVQEAIIASAQTEDVLQNADEQAERFEGESLIAPAEPDYSNIPTNRLSMYQNIKQRQQVFWKRFSVEYLNTLQQRMKNRRLSPNLYVGQLVIIKEDNLPPLKWAMGRIVSLHPGSDGLVRVVEIRTSGGVMKRSISKICPLPTEQQLTELENDQAGHVNAGGGCSPFLK